MFRSVCFALVSQRILQLLLRLEPYKIACHFYYFSRVGGGGFSPRLRCFLQDNEVTDYRDAK